MSYCTQSWQVFTAAVQTACNCSLRASCQHLIKHVGPSSLPAECARALAGVQELEAACTQLSEEQGALKSKQNQLSQERSQLQAQASRQAEELQVRSLLLQCGQPSPVCTGGVAAGQLQCLLGPGRHWS